MNQTFLNWALNQGSVSTPIGTFPGECVSLVQQYLSRVYGIPFKVRGDAKDWATNKDVLSYFDKVSTAKPGDILVYGEVPGNPYGHIGIYLGDNTMLDQNGTVARKVAKGKMWSNPIAILRRKGDNVAKPKSAEIVSHFKNYGIGVPTAKQIAYYTVNDWAVLNGDVLNAVHDKLKQKEAEAKKLSAEIKELKKDIVELKPGKYLVKG